MSDLRWTPLQLIGGMLAMIGVLWLLLSIGHHEGTPATRVQEPVPAVYTLPPIAPTPPIIVPTPQPAPVTFYGDNNSNSVTYNIQVTEVNACAAVIGCWER